MKKPIIISGFITLFAIVLTVWMKIYVMPIEQYLELVISAWASAGALISAAFVIYGYLLNIEAFTESQRPRILLQVRDGESRFLPTNEIVHQTHICYQNVGMVECTDLAMFALLVRGGERNVIPNLFEEKMNLQLHDRRDRNFPTIQYLTRNGFPEITYGDLSDYKLRVGYKVKSIGGFMERSYDYEWNASLKCWSIC